MPAMSEAPALDWERLARSAMHPTKVAILATLAALDEPIAPKDLAVRLGERLENLSYHVRDLRRQELVVLARTEPRRGAVQHYYEIAAGVAIMEVKS